MLQNGYIKEGVGEDQEEAEDRFLPFHPGIVNPAQPLPLQPGGAQGRLNLICIL